jgi:hypothetical protein
MMRQYNTYDFRKEILFIEMNKTPRCKSKRIRKKWNKKYGHRLEFSNIIIPKIIISVPRKYNNECLYFKLTEFIGETK